MRCMAQWSCALCKHIGCGKEHVMAVNEKGRRYRRGGLLFVPSEPGMKGMLEL